MKKFSTSYRIFETLDEIKYPLPSPNKITSYWISYIAINVKNVFINVFVTDYDLDPNGTVSETFDPKCKFIVLQNLLVVREVFWK